MFGLIDNSKIFSITSKAPKYVFFVFVIVLSIGLLEALVLSPEDYIQSHSVRIMYVHVPSAWISIGIFLLIGILSIGSVIFKNKIFSIIAKSLAPSGLVFNIIALVTGSIWGNNMGYLVGWIQGLLLCLFCVYFISCIFYHGGSLRTKIN